MQKCSSKWRIHYRLAKSGKGQWVHVEFPDGTMKKYAANEIAENMISQVDDEGFSSTLMDGIVDYQKDPAVAVAIEDKILSYQTEEQENEKDYTGVEASCCMER